MIVLRGLGRDADNPNHAYGVMVTHGIGRHWYQSGGSTWLYQGKIEFAIIPQGIFRLDALELHEALCGVLAIQKYIGNLVLDKNLGRINIPERYSGKLQYEPYAGRLSKA